MIVKFASHYRSFIINIVTPKKEYKIGTKGTCISSLANLFRMKIASLRIMPKSACKNPISKFITL